MSFSIFNKVLISSLCLLLLPLIALIFYMEPFSNELTRVGGYLENDYGWNIPQEHFQKPLFKKASSIEDYKQHYDVIIVGDSFSDDESHGWQNYLANETGLTILLFNVFSVSVDDIINSETYLKNPPKLFIYESVERNIISQRNQCEYDKLPINSNFTPPSYNIAPLSIPVGKISRKRNINSIKDINLNSSINVTTHPHRLQFSPQAPFELQ